MDADGEKEIESFQLQILCQYIEERIVIGRNDTYVELGDLGNLEDIYQGYYDYNIARLGSDSDIQSARLLLEEGLIFEEEERRISLYEGQINGAPYYVSPDLLQRIERTRLIRPIPNPDGGYSYELSHDTLVSPILKSKAKRVEIEERNRAIAEAEINAKRQLELERAQRAKARRRLILFGIIGLGIIASLLVFNSFLNKEKNIALAEKQRADSLRLQSDSLLALTERLLKTAELEKVNAEIARNEAQESELKALQQSQIASKERANALEQAGIAREALMQTIYANLSEQEGTKQEVVGGFFGQEVSSKTDRAQQLIFDEWLAAEDTRALKRGAKFYLDIAQSISDKQSKRSTSPAEKERLEKIKLEYQRKSLAFFQKASKKGVGFQEDVDPVPILMTRSAYLMEQQQFKEMIEYGEFMLKEYKSPTINRLYPNLAFSYFQLDSLDKLRSIYAKVGPQPYPAKFYYIGKNYSPWSYDNGFQALWGNLHIWRNKYKWVDKDIEPARKILMDEWIKASADSTAIQPWLFFSSVNNTNLKTFYGTRLKEDFYIPAYEQAITSFLRQVEYSGVPPELGQEVPPPWGTKGRGPSDKYYAAWFDYKMKLIRAFQKKAFDHLKNNEPQKAIALLEKWRSMFPDFRKTDGILIPTLVVSYLFDDQWDKAVEIMESRKHDKFPDYQIHASYLWRITFADDSYWGAFANHFTYWRASWLKGRRQALLDKALEYVKEKWIECKLPMALEDGGNYFTRTGYKGNPDYKTGLQLYEKALALGSKSEKLIEYKITLTSLARARRLFSFEQYDKVIECAQKSLELVDKGVPNNVRLIPTLISAYIVNDQWDKAEPLLQEYASKPYPVEKYGYFREAILEAMYFYAEKLASPDIREVYNKKFERARIFLGK